MKKGGKGKSSSLGEKVGSLYTKTIDKIKYFGGGIPVRTLAEVSAAAALGVGSVGAVIYLTTPGADASQSASVKDERKKQNLEELMNTTEQVIVKATYETVNTVGPKKEVTINFSGSAVCVYKNLAEDNVFFLTCAHVTDVPQEMMIWGFSANASGLYDVDIRDKNNKSIPRQAFSLEDYALSGNAKLKHAEIGIFNGYDHGSGGQLSGVNLISAKVLADSGINEVQDWIYDEDVALFKADSKYVFGNPGRFTVFEGDFAAEEEIHPGDKVWAIGFPGSLGKQVCSGEIRRKDDPYTARDNTFTLMTAPINGGNSGGPVFLEKEIQEVMDDGTVKTEKVYKLAGLSRLCYLGMLSMTGMSKACWIKDLLKKEGYSYIYKK